MKLPEETMDIVVQSSKKAKGERDKLFVDDLWSLFQHALQLDIADDNKNDLTQVHKDIIARITSIALEFALEGSVSTYSQSHQLLRSTCTHSSQNLCNKLLWLCSSQNNMNNIVRLGVLSPTLYMSSHHSPRLCKRNRRGRTIES